MLARLSAFVIWTLIAATAVFWGLRLAVHPAPAPLHAVAIGDTSAGKGDLTRLLGAPPVSVTAAATAPEPSSRFRLLGIMATKRARAGGPGHGGLALIAVDGKPARAFAVGSHLDADLVLQSVSLRTASIGPAQGAQTVVLEIPPLAAAATGTLPAVGSPVAPAPGLPQPVPATFPAPPAGMSQPPVLPPAAVVPPGTGSVQRESSALNQ